MIIMHNCRYCSTSFLISRIARCGPFRLESNNSRLVDVHIMVPRSKLSLISAVYCRPLSIGHKMDSGMEHTLL